MVRLLIDEEYGYRTWYAEMTTEEYELLLKRWETLQGLRCSVPVTLVIPQAKEVSDEEATALIREYLFGECVQTPRLLKCHMHDYDDSYLQGSGYEIPNAAFFTMEGKTYPEFGDYSAYLKDETTKE